ncbi:MAG: hypothetical protein OHK0023_20170 [Anaerolineae bacterium]
MLVMAMSSMLVPSNSIRAQDGPPSPTPSRLYVEQNALLELPLAVPNAYANPTDPNEVSVTVRFSAPNDQVIGVPAFWMRFYNQICNADCSEESFVDLNQTGWFVRFRPNQVGIWQYVVELRDADGERVLNRGDFEVTPSTRRGVIGVGRNRRYFAYAEGDPYFPVGINLAWSWSGTGNTRGYTDWLDQLARLGANYARLYLDTAWFIGIGWVTPAGDLREAQTALWRLDQILQAASARGIALQLVITSAANWNTYTPPPYNPPAEPRRADVSIDWARNPFNVLRGGTFNTAATFFTAPEGREVFKERLRYLIARYSAYESVFAWELVDQLDRLTPSNLALANDWANEMIGYLRQNDPSRHLITFGVSEGTRLQLFTNLAVDFHQIRYYQRLPSEPITDQFIGTLEQINTLPNRDQVPLLINEFSLSQWFEPSQADPQGIHVRTTLWTAALSGSSGAFSWWWDTYLFPQNLTEMLTALAYFTRGVPWDTANLQPISVALRSDDASIYLPLRVTGMNEELGSQTPPDIFYRISPEGVSPPLETASAYLYGTQFNTQLAQPLQLVITPPTDTILTVRVVRSSDRAGARLMVRVDGSPSAVLELNPNSRGASLSVPLTPGEHVVVLDNAGADYVQLEALELAQYLAPIRAVALADRGAGVVLAYFQHQDYTWQNTAELDQIQPISMQAEIAELPSGLYRVEYWDVFSGTVVGLEDVRVEGESLGILRLNLPPLNSLLAIRAVRYAEPANFVTPTLTPTATPRASPTTTATP